MNRRKFVRNISVATSTMIVGGSLANELVGSFSDPNGFLNSVNEIDAVNELYSGGITSKSFWLQTSNYKGPIATLYPQDGETIEPYGNLEGVIKSLNNGIRVKRGEIFVI